MEIDPYCQRQNCSPLNVLFIDVQISLILLGVRALGGYNYITPRRADLSATAGLPCYIFFPSDLGCLGGAAVWVSNFRSSGCGFDSRPGRNQGT